MGYYTDFNIRQTGDDDFEEISEEIVNISGYCFDEYSSEKRLFLNAKWYNWDVNMTEISRKFPNSLFQVDGEGEEGHDIWRCFFRNGRCESIKVEVKYSESNLETEFKADAAVHKMLTET